MTSLILELQKKVLDPNISVTDLLRHALLVAKKLGLKEFEHWIQSELNGYANKDLIPDYRKVRGIPVAIDEWGNYNPIDFSESEMQPSVLEKLSTSYFLKSIDQIESSVEKAERSIIITYPFETETMLVKALDEPCKPALNLSRTEYTKILNAVKNTLLNWSLELEANGILGDEINFSKAEKEEASAKANKFSISALLFSSSTDKSDTEKE